jgi:hypothetical protein
MPVTTIILIKPQVISLKVNKVEEPKKGLLSKLFSSSSNRGEFNIEVVCSFKRVFPDSISYSSMNVKIKKLRLIFKCHTIPINRKINNQEDILLKTVDIDIDYEAYEDDKIITSCQQVIKGTFSYKKTGISNLIFKAGEKKVELKDY